MRLSLALPAALVLALALPAPLAFAVPPSQATMAQKDDAQAHFLRGKELFGQKKLEAALVELRASVEIVQSPNARLYVARCLRDLGRLPQAYAELVRTEADARDDAHYEKAAEAAREERAEIEPKLGFVEVRGGKQVKVAGEERKSEAMPVLPGTVEIAVGSAIQMVEITAGQHAIVTIEPEPEPLPMRTREVVVVRPQAESPLRTGAFIAGGAALAGLTAFIVAGAMANATHKDLENACGSSPCPPGHEDEIARGRMQQTVANIGLGVLVGGAATAVTLFVLGTPKANVSAGLGDVRLSGQF